MAEFLIKQDSERPRFSFERGGSWFFAGSLLIFILALVSVGGLIVLNKSKMSERGQLDAQNQAKLESVRPELLDTVSVLDKRLKNLRILLGAHVFTSNIFKVIEQDTHPQVKFSNFNFTADSRKVDMSGEAASYSVLARQIGISCVGGARPSTTLASP